MPQLTEILLGVSIKLTRCLRFFTNAYCFSTTRFLSSIRCWVQHS